MSQCFPTSFHREREASARTCNRECLLSFQSFLLRAAIKDRPCRSNWNQPTVSPQAVPCTKPISDQHIRDCHSPAPHPPKMYRFQKKRLLFPLEPHSFRPYTLLSKLNHPPPSATTIPQQLSAATGGELPHSRLHYAFLHMHQASRGSPSDA